MGAADMGRSLAVRAVSRHHTTPAAGRVLGALQGGSRRCEAARFGREGAAVGGYVLDTVTGARLSRRECGRYRR